MPQERIYIAAHSAVADSRAFHSSPNQGSGNASKSFAGLRTFINTTKLRCTDYQQLESVLALTATNMASQLHLADTTRFKIRPAQEDDLQTLTNDVWFHSFGVNPFWAYLFPDSTICRREYLDKLWAIGLRNPTDRTFVVVDTQEHDRVVALSRWQVPQKDGNRDRECWLWNI
jgi:hypothetical protein